MPEAGLLGRFAPRMTENAHSLFVMARHRILADRQATVAWLAQPWTIDTGNRTLFASMVAGHLRTRYGNSPMHPQMRRKEGR
jgi:hypothetical protein